jgi:RNA polymerase sigma factor for flagellar operon FliA
MSATPQSRPDPADVWKVYGLTRSQELRDRLIVRYAPLVKYVAGRLAMGLPPTIDVDDLTSYGVFGLINAIERYDPGRQVKFETYAIARIRGAMLDGLRASDWIPYSVRQKAKELERAYSRLEARLGRSATDSELAAELGIGSAALGKMLLDVRALTLSSLDETWNGEDEEGNGLKPMEVIEDSSSDDPVDLVEFEERKGLLAAAVRALPERERLIVTLYYYEGLTAKEISQILGVSQSRISQLHSKAIMRLRAHLSEEFHGLPGSPGQPGPKASDQPCR